MVDMFCGSLHIRTLWGWWLCWDDDIRLAIRKRCWRRWRYSVTSAVDKPIKMTCKSVEITHGYVVGVPVGYEGSHDHLVNLDNNKKAVIRSTFWRLPEKNVKSQRQFWNIFIFFNYRSQWKRLHRRSRGA